MKTLKACSGTTGRRNWKKGGVCTGEADPGDPWRAASAVPVPDVTSALRWGNWKDGTILNVAATSISDLPVDQRFREDKRLEFEASQVLG